MKLASTFGSTPRGWALALVIAAGLSGLVAYAPLPTSLGVLAAATGAVLVRGVGLRLAAWLIFIATIPLRPPLSIDVLGTRTLFLNDVVLLGLFAATLYERGIRDIWRASWTFRLGVLLFVLSMLGLYSASRFAWGANFALCMAAQVSIYYVGWYLVRDGRVARWTLLAFVAGMIPAAIYGIYQSTLPLNAFSQDEMGYIPPLAWDSAGQPHVRINATFDHQLRCALALSAATALALGLALQTRSARRALLVGLATLFAYCNQFTYSVGGLIGTATTVLALALVAKRSWTLVALPVALLGWLIATGGTLMHRATQMAGGSQSTLIARLLSYQQSFQVLRDHPLLGIGWGNIRTAFEGEYRLARSENVVYSPENYFLQYAVALGLVGLAVTLTICVRFVRSVLTKPPDTPEGREWPRAALIVGGATCWVQVQTFAAGDYTSAYLLWFLIVLAERMQIAARESRTDVAASPAADSS